MIHYDAVVCYMDPKIQKCVVEYRDVRKTEIRFRFGFYKSEPSKNLTSVQTIFRQKLRANPQFMLKVTKNTM